MKMHIVILIFLVAFYGRVVAQDNAIVFNYDKAGNMIERKITIFPQFRMGKIPQNHDSDLVNTILFNVFPNPANTEIKIIGELPEKIESAKVKLINLSGQTLRSGIYYGKELSINVEGIVNGAYVLELMYAKNKKSSYKIIINN